MDPREPPGSPPSPLQPPHPTGRTLEKLWKQRQGGWMDLKNFGGEVKCLVWDIYIYICTYIYTYLEPKWPLFWLKRDEKGLVLEGWPSKIEVSWVLGILYIRTVYSIHLAFIWGCLFCIYIHIYTLEVLGTLLEFMDHHSVRKALSSNWNNHCLNFKWLTSRCSRVYII